MSATKNFAEEVSLAIDNEGKISHNVMRVAAFVCDLAQIRNIPKDNLTSKNTDFVRLCKKVDDDLHEGNPVFSINDIHLLVKHLCNSHDGDERLMGEALRFYTNGNPDDLVAVLNSSIMQFEFVLKAVKKKINQGR